MFPQLRLTPARARLCSAGSARHCVPRRHRSYAALRLPRSLRPPLRSSLASGLPRCGGLVLHRRTGAPRQPVQTPETFLPRLPASRLSTRGKTRVSQVPGPSSSCVPWSTTPPGATTPRPFSVRSLLPSGESIPWAPGNMFLSWLPTHGPLARVPTLRRIRYRLRRKARYRPGGLTLRRAGFAPAGRQTRFHGVIAYSIPPLTSLAWSHCPRN